MMLNESQKGNTYRWSCRLKAFLQTWQTCFRSSLWVNLCFAMALELLNTWKEGREMRILLNNNKYKKTAIFKYFFIIRIRRLDLHARE